MVVEVRFPVVRLGRDGEMEVGCSSQDDRPERWLVAACCFAPSACVARRIGRVDQMASGHKKGRLEVKGGRFGGGALDWTPEQEALLAANGASDESGDGEAVVSSNAPHKSRETG